MFCCLVLSKCVYCFITHSIVFHSCFVFIFSLFGPSNIYCQLFWVLVIERTSGFHAVCHLNHVVVLVWPVGHHRFLADTDVSEANTNVKPNQRVDWIVIFPQTFRSSQGIQIPK